MKKKTLTDQELAVLCRSFALLLHAGVSLGDGMYLLAEEESGQRKTLLTTLGRKLDGGALLSDCMEESGVFPLHAIGMVRVGERTGRTEDALNALSSYYDEQARTTRQIRNALTYPSILLLMMLAVVVVLLVKVLPVFDEVYASLGTRLTGLAGGLLQLGGALDTAMPALCVIVALVAVFLILFSASAGFRAAVLGFWRRSFGDRGVSRRMNEARFAQALSMGLRSGLPLEESLGLAGDLLSDVPAAAQRCKDCSAALLQGVALGQALGQTQLLPPASCRMLALGMRAGNGDQVMEDIAAQLSEEAGEALSNRVAQVEPAMVLVSMLLVGVILLAVMLPLMNIMSTIG